MQKRCACQALRNLSGCGKLGIYFHLNVRSLSEFRLQNLVYALPKLNASKMKCETCLRCKQSRLNFASDMPKR